MTTSRMERAIRLALFVVSIRNSADANFHISEREYVVKPKIEAAQIFDWTKAIKLAAGSHVT